MMRFWLLSALLLAGCAPLATDSRPTTDGCEWARPIVMPPVLDVVTRDLATDHPEVRRFREDLAAHNRGAVENCIR